MPDDGAEVGLKRFQAFEANDERVSADRLGEKRSNLATVEPRWGPSQKQRPGNASK